MSRCSGIAASGRRAQPARARSGERSRLYLVLEHVLATCLARARRALRIAFVAALDLAMVAAVAALALFLLRRSGARR